jgi:hypothetical protein
MMLNEEDDHVRGKGLERRRRPGDERANYWQVLHIKYECVGFVAELRWLPGSEGWMADIGSGSTRRSRIPFFLNWIMRDLRVSNLVKNYC